MHMRGTAQLSQASPLVSHLGNTMVKPGSGSLAALEHKLGKNHFSISTSGRIRYNKMRKLKIPKKELGKATQEQINKMREILNIRFKHNPD